MAGLSVDIDGVTIAKGGTIPVSGLFDEIEFNELAVINQVYNYYRPLAGSRFILTGVVATADKDVVADATVVIYEASNPESTTVDKVLFQFVLLKNQQLVIPNFKIAVTPDVWINGKTDDDDIHMSLVGHFVKT
tara:strand:- start:3450 stop:3851 length:402 start_codon:yes stop_codon:yes gene_type:complete